MTSFRPGSFLGTEFFSWLNGEIFDVDRNRNHELMNPNCSCFKVLAPFKCTNLQTLKLPKTRTQQNTTKSLEEHLNYFCNETRNTITMKLRSLKPPISSYCRDITLYRYDALIWTFHFYNIMYVFILYIHLYTKNDEYL